MAKKTEKGRRSRKQAEEQPKPKGMKLLEIRLSHGRRLPRDTTVEAEVDHSIDPPVVRVKLESTQFPVEPASPYMRKPDAELTW